jgi:dipeptidyl aminopeptidase/acylaminoacyl peptidase
MPAIHPYLSVRSAAGPTFSDYTGKWIYLMNLTDTFQVFAQSEAGAWPEMLTDYVERVTGVAAAPTGPGLIISRDQGGGEYHQIYWMNLETRDEAALTTNARAVHLFGAFAPYASRIAYTSTARNGRDFDVYVQSVASPSEVKLVKELSGHWEVKHWTEDDALIVQERRVYAVDERLHRLTLADGEITPLTPDVPAVFDSPALAADGELYARTDVDRDFMGLARIASSGRVEYLLTYDADIELLAANEGGTLLAYSVNRNGYSELHLYDPASKTDTHINAFDQEVILSLTFASDGQSLAVTHSAPRRNMNISVVSVETHDVRQWTGAPMPGLNPGSFAAPSIIYCPSFDGLQVPAFVYRPGASSAAPVVLSVHGGPEAQERPYFNPLYQYLTASGYAVVAPNVRGSSGYGKSYVHLDDREKRMDSVADLKAVVDFIRQDPGLDETRIAIYGGSYGGFMVLSGITQYPDLFRAAIDIVGISNLETFLENTSEYRRALRESEYGYLATDREFLRKFSPIHYVDRIQAALFVVHGANDPRVPLGEAEQMVEALRAKGHPVVFRVFADEGHGLAKKSNRLIAYPEMIAFLDEHLKG